MPPREALDRFHEVGEVPEKARAFALALVEATLANREDIDQRLTLALEHWKLSRLPAVVRSLLRMAVCEMIVMEESPFQVVVNEAVETARQYMDEDSSKFVNGVLERCWINDGRELPPGRTPRPGDLAGLAPAEPPSLPQEAGLEPEPEEPDENQD